MSPRVGRTAAFGLALFLASCSDDDSFSPTVSNVAGSYSAETFMATTAAGNVDLLALGSEVTVTLATDGTTTGEIHVPGGGEDGEDLDADLTGAWTLSGSTVTFDQEADTFLRDVEFIASEDRLTTEGTFGDETLRLVLRKTD